ncbi:MAG: hypothetical protein GOU99_01125 [Candidatus Altiarchaeota archaeon]|nr:hypothetical protein [Candidatus Altiarchaeota archaeon]
MKISVRRKGWKIVKTPGARKSIHRTDKRISKDSCAACGSELSGSRRIRPNKEMCPSCARQVQKNKVRIYAQKG